MADKKRKTKKKGKTGAESGNSAENSFFWLVSGWFLFAVGIILLLGCISSVYSGSEGNWLGPFFGKMVPDTFTFVFGRLPVIFFTLALVLWGLFIALDNLRERLLSFCIGMTLLTLDLSSLMAVAFTYGKTGLARETLLSNGGVLGQFIMQYVFVSVFGKVSFVAPLVISLAVLALILVLSFGLRPRHFTFLVKTAQWFAGLFRKKDVPEGTEEEAPARSKKDMLVDDSTIYSVPDGYNIRDKADIKPFKVKRGLMGAVGGDRASQDADIALAENPYAPDATTIAPPGFRRYEEETVVAARTGNVDFEPADGEDPEIQRLEQQLRDNERNMNALQIKEIRD